MPPILNTLQASHMHGSIPTFIIAVDIRCSLCAHDEHTYSKRQCDVSLWRGCIDMCTSALNSPLLPHLTVFFSTEYLWFTSFMCFNKYSNMGEGHQTGDNKHTGNAMVLPLLARR